MSDILRFALSLLAAVTIAGIVWSIIVALSALFRSMWDDSPHEDD